MSGWYELVTMVGFLYCNKLFEYERSYREKGLSLKQIYNRRLKDQKPVIEAFLSWLDQLHPESGDRLIKAINYSNGCRPFMMNYLKDGACSLSNNLSENFFMGCDPIKNFVDGKWTVIMFGVKI